MQNTCPLLDLPRIFCQECKNTFPSLYDGWNTVFKEMWWLIDSRYSAKNAKIPFPLSMMDGTQYSRRCDGS
jgi:hypothetical protein